VFGRMLSRLRSPAAYAAAVCLVLASGFGCSGPRAVRGEDVAGLDDQALSTGLDRRDLEKLLQKSLDALSKSAVISRWEGEDRPTVAVLQIKNETSEHIESGLAALISDIETHLVNAGHVRVISRDDQPELIDEVRAQASDAFDKAQISNWGRQIGAKYFVTGKVYTTDERFEGERRVQYYLFMRVLEVETSDILFQNKSAITKAIVDG
jgi:penicillin-binding protein activator